MALEFLGTFYANWWQVIDFFIYLIIFGTIGKFVFSKQFDKGSASNGMAIGVGIALSIAMVALEIRNGFNISTMGCLVAAFVILGIVGFVTSYLVRNNAQKNSWNWVWYIVGLIIAFILIDLFFSLGFCASPFGFGLFNWFGGGGSGSGMPHSWSTAPGIPGGNWIDWIILVLALFAIYWMLRVLEGRTRDFLGRGGKAPYDRSRHDRDRSRDRQRRRERESRLPPLTPPLTETPQRLRITAVRPFQIPIPPAGRPYVEPLHIYGTGFEPGARVELTTVKWMRGLVLPSNRRHAQGIAVQVLQPEENQLICRVNFTPNNPQVRDGMHYDVWVVLPNGERTVARNALRLGPLVPGPARDASIDAALNRIETGCRQLEQEMRNNYLSTANTYLSRAHVWYNEIYRLVTGNSTLANVAHFGNSTHSFLTGTFMPLAHDIDIRFAALNADLVSLNGRIGAMLPDQLARYGTLHANYHSLNVHWNSLVSTFNTQDSTMQADVTGAGAAGHPVNNYQFTTYPYPILFP